jgi:hypothetical protein
MLTGELPLGRFAPPSQKVQVDVRLDEVVLHAMEREPERRYQHASDVKTDLESIGHGTPISAYEDNPSNLVSGAGTKRMERALPITHLLEEILRPWYTSLSRRVRTSLRICLLVLLALCIMSFLFVDGWLSNSVTPPEKSSKLVYGIHIGYPSPWFVHERRKEANQSATQFTGTTGPVLYSWSWPIACLGVVAYWLLSAISIIEANDRSPIYEIVSRIFALVCSLVVMQCLGGIIVFGITNSWNSFGF